MDQGIPVYGLLPFAIVAVITLFLTHSVRGTIYYHRIRKTVSIKKNVAIVSVLGLIYAIAMFLVGGVLAVILESFISSDSMLTVTLLVSSAMLFLAFMRVLPLTSKTAIVSYSLSEEEIEQPRSEVQLLEAKRGNRTIQTTILPHVSFILSVLPHVRNAVKSISGIEPLNALYWAIETAMLLVGAILVGIIALCQKEGRRGRGWAIAGITIGALQLSVLVLGFLEGYSARSQ